MSDEIIVCENLVKIYKTTDVEVVALQGLDLVIERGEMMAIIGNSGSGKSTLLNMLGGLDRPSAGRLTVDGRDLLKYTDGQLVQYKKETVGFVWQNNARNLIPYLTALENVELPMLISNKKHRRELAMDMLQRVGLAHKRHSRLNQLSGGEQQRVAISIALANRPKILLADEPTGSVDTATADLILDLFAQLNQELGITIIIVTHDRHISRKVNRVVAIRDGRTSSEYVLKKSYRDMFEELGAEDAPQESDTHVELAVVDRTGRLQIPREYLAALGMSGKNKISVALDGDRVVLMNPEKPEEHASEEAAREAPVMEA